MTLWIIAAVVLLALIGIAALWSHRQPPPDPEVQARNAAKAEEAMELRASTTANARALALARADNHFAERLRAAYEEGVR